MAPKIKRLEKQDRISELPDALIQHILSFLPSSKQAIRTGILSKRWHKQWTQVPVLIFNPAGMSRDKFLDFIDKTLLLHDCSRINTFHLHYNRLRHCRRYENDPRFDDKIRFATTKQVEDLCLRFSGFRDECFLPDFLFNATSMVKLKTRSCSLFPSGKVNWVCLKALDLAECRFSSEALEHILSGSPLLEWFQLKRCSAFVEFGYLFDKLVITSKSLKKLVLISFDVDVLEISCPNLKKLSITRLVGAPKLFDEAIEYAMSKCLLLESFELFECRRLRHPVIASRSLKKLVISHLSTSEGPEIFCPKLEHLKLSGWSKIKNLKLKDVPSSLCATLDLFVLSSTRETHNSFTEDNILQQLQHVKKLTVGKFFHEKLGVSVVGPFFPLLHIKCLILDNPFRRKTLSGIASLLRSLPILEVLVFKFSSDDHYYDFLKLDTFGENSWSTNANGFDCLVSHLKTVKIGCSLWGNSKPSQILNFVQFLLNNARVLENFTVVLTVCPKQHSFIVSQELFGFNRCSEHAIVELISKCS